MNNFKELERMQTEKYESSLKNIKKNIDSNMSTIGVFTQIVDVYFSKVINYVVSLSGGSEDKLNQKEEDLKDQ